jgi:eukaryotic-like serine/threonine-protein kinase
MKAGSIMSVQPQSFGKYQLLQRLGSGGMAEVWKAFDPQLRRNVAIKYLHANLRTDPDFMIRFVREAQAIALLRHPNIVQIYDFQIAEPDSENPVAYMVMEYMESETLADYIRRLRQNNSVGTLPPAKEIVSLFTPICLAVDYAHQHGIIHRDIKPSNILLDKHNAIHNAVGEPVLSDFGVVKMMGTEVGTLTSSGTGTPMYVPPEQARGLPGNERSDIYSLGVILYEIYTGTLPFRGDNARAIMMQHIMERPTPPRLINPNIPPALEIVILRCMEKDPDARFPRAASLVAALAEALNVPVPEEVKDLKYPEGLADQPTHFNFSTSDFSTLTPPENGNAKQAASPSGATPTPQEQLPKEPQRDQTPPSFIPYQSYVDQLPAIPSKPLQPSSSPVQPVKPGEVQAEKDAIANLQPSSSPVQPVKPAGLFKQPVANSKLYLVLIALALVLLIGTGLLALLQILPPRPAPVASNPIVGHAYFTSSGEVASQGPSGMDDTVHVILSHLPAPPAGEHYYGWLLSDKTQAETQSTSLGKLTFNNGSATLSYTDPQHQNLLADNSRFLVTLDDDRNGAPLDPITTHSTWRYFAEFPDTPGSDGTTGLTHLRHLLTNEPTLQRFKLNGGVAFWFLQNVEEIQRWSKESIDNGNFTNRRQKVINILYILHGQCANQDLQNAPAGAIRKPDVGIETTQIPLLECPQNPDPAGGYVRHTLFHLNGLIQSPGATADQKQLAAQITREMDDVNANLEQILKDDQKLVLTDNAHFDTAPERQDIGLQISDALSGWVDPNTHVIHPGAAIIYEQIQSLATFDVQPYTGK